jgi:tetratricopeptide (TPR) repeat protein
MAKSKIDDKEKEQIRQEKVEETVSKTDEFFRKNKKTIYGAFIAILVIGLAVVAYYKFIYQPKSDEAIAQMYPAEANFRNGEWELALNGDGNVLGFAQIIDDFGAKGGKDVYFYAGVCELQLGKYQEAIDYLKKYKGKDEILAARAMACIGDAYVGLEKYKESLNYYDQAAAKIDNMFAATYLLKAGVVCEEMGDNAKALTYYKKIKDQYPQSMEGYDIDKYITRIESQQETK